MNKSSSSLEPGDRVLTTRPHGTDFGLPLVAPWKSRRYDGAVVREVHGTCKAQGGTRIWFTDGTKTEPIHGRTVWILG